MRVRRAVVNAVMLAAIVVGILAGSAIFAALAG
jgi:hypothetical protein